MRSALRHGTIAWPALLVVLLVLLLAPRRQPWFRVPPQRHPPAAAEVLPPLTPLSMADPSASRHIVRDIDEGVNANAWRWTRRNPTLKFVVLSPRDLHLAADFTLWPVAFQQTGPVTITWRINGRILDQVRYDTPGEKHFARSVPDGWLQPDEEALASAEVDKLYRSERDAQNYGFILSRMGFARP